MPAACGGIPADIAEIRALLQGEQALSCSNFLVVERIDDTTTRIRVSFPQGGPRYFKVKFSEEM